MSRLISAFGTKRTSRPAQPMSAVGGKADIALMGWHVAFDPTSIQNVISFSATASGKFSCGGAVWANQLQTGKLSGSPLFIIMALSVLYPKEIMTKLPSWLRSSANALPQSSTLSMIKVYGQKPAMVCLQEARFHANFPCARARLVDAKRSLFLT